ncbi:DNA phosphorothioation-dependent restriction protein DptG [Tepidibacter aestuarii]|uniref:DNA phosphorothioation-dependent restriction protein DptG n=1 Tax=Tepidibacter aestuarii TaxID=2925782 RepID=UPI0020BEFB45|nr:DNA phosphorothioation-dependent restriction protein DptG [Tepidibacter aestuarii]CAH2213350.1 DNA phosphorothioation-dependent restriction protein DptG [Tepidibacter aestuarii]
MRYEIKIDDIEKNYVKKGSFKHNAETKPWMLPSTTQYKESQKPEIINFTAAVGAFSRNLTKKKEYTNFCIEKYYNDIISQISIDKKNKSILIDLITELFFQGENLIIFHPKTLNYIESTHFNNKLGQFLFDVLYKEDHDIFNLIAQAYGKNSNNILINLMTKNLPQLDENQNIINKYKNFNPYISKIFMADFKYLLENSDMLIDNLEKILKFYYMFYVSQSAMILNKTFEADIEKPMNVYFGLDWENTGKGRLNTELGWKVVESNVLRLFSHANALHLINHNNENKKYSYVELKDRIDSMSIEEKIDFVNDVNNLIDFYKGYIIDVEWDNFKYTPKFENECYDAVYKLFKIINYQFDNSGRKKRQKDYGTRFVEFCKANFLRQRGRYGYIFNLTEEYTIFLTKICIKDNEKIKLKDLFVEFKKRGISLDNDSKVKLIQLYEKLNILEKKSDSGDAQYVKRIL